MRKLTKRKAALLGSSLLAVSALAIAPGVLRNVPDIGALFGRYQPALEEPKLTLKQPHFLLEPDAPDYLLSGSPHTLPAEPELAALVPDMPAWIAHPETLRRTSSPYYGGHAADGSPAGTSVSRQVGSSGSSHGTGGKSVDPLDTPARKATPTIAANVPQSNVPQSNVPQNTVPQNNAPQKHGDESDATPDVQPESNPGAQPESKPAPGAIAGDNADGTPDATPPTTPGTETEPTQPTAGDTGPDETELAGLTPPPNDLHNPVGGDDNPEQNPDIVRVPEPGSLALLAVGIIGLLVCRRRA